ncbi:adenine phosphoribosyltransferase [Wolinella succinogenes]|uniref:Adenine phosphoribosyltransferase n=1 Tax=Wolinella succinogenes (strain ATCC 29543 / DSM 1740 / CCUG 13145 / JCM 31913 / LMG 7466 / NCTC 11488 / FDC 602W) TaxID=273121 RepID=APT_WOLSU|nr:adenine phosphoribosyltransferase [Wolinella succinogenes]Q7M8W8.1 RecName: Full=Adenine phosphoribosyltransferase; Short=APRT [Wolinella succinogenes DSM 1740]HCZ19227.1 adenine phosphoribosyltransferase [Helicobacter sp.]NLU35158.1 adenine phosphoribosyltransferase [Wolinella succinogenes]CAE10421.1 ADENINE PHOSPHORIBOSYLTRANSFERASE [Wolinella succinogenes]VEG80537.1 Adenine phosphoribosyltransferase [Wolinella succinogenes]
MSVLDENQKQFLLDSIRNIPDFPKPGIQFKDITTLLNDPKAFGFLIDFLTDRYARFELDYVAGIESRGFIFGAALAAKLEVGFVPIRKKGKLPSTTIAEKYSLEYGFDEVEIHIDAFREKEGSRVLLIDDLIATGGTAEAAVKLIQSAKGHCVEACFLLNLEELGGAKKVSNLAPLYTLLDI